MKDDKNKVAEAIMAGAKMKEESKPMPFLEGDDDLDFTEGKGNEDEEDTITKAFQILWQT